MKAAWSLLLAASALPGTVGCSRPAPSGQVVARVDGTDITRRDLLVELTASGADATADVGPVAPLLVEDLVARRLLVAEAQRRSIDRSPEFLGQMRRNRDLLLVQLLQQRLAESAAPATTRTVDQFARAHDDAFARRKVIAVDRLSTRWPVPEQAVATLTSADGAAAWLASRCIPFARSPVLLDSLAETPARIASLLASNGALVVTHADGSVLFEQVTDTQARPVTVGERTAVTRALLAQSALQRRLAQLEQSLRAQAHIVLATRNVLPQQGSCTSQTR